MIALLGVVLKGGRKGIFLVGIILRNILVCFLILFRKRGGRKYGFLFDFRVGSVDLRRLWLVVNSLVV